METSSKTTSTGRVKWSELPKELVAIIGKHLDSRIDVFRFRSICSSWRSAVSSSHLQSQTLSVNLPPPIDSTAILSHFTICRLEDESNSAACLVKVVESNSSGKLELLNPLTTCRTSIIPQFINDDHNNNNKNNNRKIINMLDFRLVELIKGYSFDVKQCRPGFRIKKAILFDNNVGMFALFESGKLRYWVLGDEKWTRLGKEGARYDDVMVYKGRFYVIDSLGIISWIDDKSMNLVQYAPSLCGFGQLKNLVVSNGEFYVVESYFEEVGIGAGNPMLDYRHRSEKLDIKVYKLDEEWGTWVDVKSLGNRVFVLNKEVSFSVSVEDFPGCEGDCIYFVDPRLEDCNVMRTAKRWSGRVFRFDNGSIRTVEYFPGYSRLFLPSMNWSFPASSST